MQCAICGKDMNNTSKYKLYICEEGHYSEFHNQEYTMYRIGNAYFELHIDYDMRPFNIAIDKERERYRNRDVVISWKKSGF